SIMKSDNTGETQGALFFGKFLTSEFIQSLAQKIEIPVNLTTTEVNNQAPSVTFVDENKTIATDFIGFSNSQSLRVKITIEQPRPFYQQAIQASLYSILTVLLVGIIACIATYFLLRGLLITPILYLQKQAEVFRENNNKLSFKVLNRRDEIGALSSSFAAMAEDLSHYLGHLRNERNELEKTSYTDALTGLHNRRYMEDFLQDPESWQLPSTWSFFTIDLDFFKKVNDTYGHDVGDITLQQFAALMVKNFREDDILIRSGGEEFTIICRHAESDTAKKLAERIINETANFRFGPDHSIPMTCSVGFFSNRIQSADSGVKHWRQMLKVSDLSLYAAKHSGRNTWIGLECNDCADDGNYPDQGQEIAQWITNNRFKLVSHLAAMEIHWFKNSLVN
ncbi:MAG: diguanylate cyclase, partial [Neptuniibacter sp.]